MDADFSVEPGDEDPVLDCPWTDASGKLASFDLKRQPDLLALVAPPEFDSCFETWDNLLIPASPVIQLPCTRLIQFAGSPRAHKIRAAPLRLHLLETFAAHRWEA